jgi:hypothetical protein
MTSTASSRASLVLLLVNLVACDATIASNDELGDDGETTSDEGGSSFAPCSDAAPCPDGESCFNGTCVLGCTSNAECGESQFCDDDSQSCQSEQVATCGNDDDCVAGQICVGQLCSTPPTDTQCEPFALTMDGCPSNALCLAQDDSQACYTMPACSADDTCPVGLQGAVCNVDYVPDKDRICMVSVCAGVEHCPADWSCIKWAANDPLGVCGNGTFGSPCTSDLDCLSGACFLLVGVGFCQ